MKVKLAEALLRRKELQQKVERLKQMDNSKLYEVKMRRQHVTDSFDDVMAEVPKVSMQQFQHCYDWHAKQLRLIDAAIQQANWTCDLDIGDSVMADYIDPYVK